MINCKNITVDNPWPAHLVSIIESNNFSPKSLSSTSFEQWICLPSPAIVGTLTHTCGVESTEIFPVTTTMDIMIIRLLSNLRYNYDNYLSDYTVNSKIKVYVAGPMTGISEYNRPAFNEAMVNLEKRGHPVMNPATLRDGFSRADYMRVYLAMIDSCDRLVFLPGWRDSEGAMVEYHYAKTVGKSLFELQTNGDHTSIIELV